MYTIDALYRLYKKHGPFYFQNFIEENPKYKSMVNEVLEMDNYSRGGKE